MSDEDVSDLRDSTSAFDDPLMTSYDLAFYLATHGYNAVPEDGCVVLVLEGSTYNLIPNGEKPGLCDILVNYHGLKSVACDYAKSHVA